ncbi:hypothetical protein JQC91_01115 [Jannaschia sp. Os4]|uniref:hypothetical protein n=1 Tax=Jannaschia sp. Os4 TaxID=2807617 RepID=UPI00193A5D07|nr:hypothetical protein [Jannaschia sp. Os4]MBM2574892.1 hypothetical protein [Jannaschia sp. Os4]
MDLIREVHPAAEIVEAETPSDLVPAGPDAGTIVVVLQGDESVFEAVAETSAIASSGASVLAIPTGGASQVASDRGWTILRRPFTDADFHASIDIAKSGAATGRRTVGSS